MTILLREGPRDNREAQVQDIIHTHMERADRAASTSRRAWHERRAETWLSRLDRLRRRGGEAR